MVFVALNRQEIKAMLEKAYMNDEVETVLADSEMINHMLESANYELAHSYTVVGVNEGKLQLISNAYLYKKIKEYIDLNGSMVLEMLSYYVAAQPKEGSFEFFKELIGRIQFTLTYVPIEHYVSFHDVVIGALHDHFGNKKIDTGAQKLIIGKNLPSELMASYKKSLSLFADRLPSEPILKLLQIMQKVEQSFVGNDVETTTLLDPEECDTSPFLDFLENMHAAALLIKENPQGFPLKAVGLSVKFDHNETTRMRDSSLSSEENDKMMDESDIMGVELRKLIYKHIKKELEGIYLGKVFSIFMDEESGIELGYGIIDRVDFYHAGVEFEDSKASIFVPKKYFFENEKLRLEEKPAIHCADRETLDENNKENHMRFRKGYAVTTSEDFRKLHGQKFVVIRMNERDKVYYLYPLELYSEDTPLRVDFIVKNDIGGLMPFVDSDLTPLTDTSVNHYSMIERIIGCKVVLNSTIQVSKDTRLHRFNDDEVHMLVDGAGGYELIIDPQGENEKIIRGHLGEIKDVCISALSAGDKFIDDQLYSKNGELEFKIIGDHVYMVTDNSCTTVIARDVGNTHGIVLSIHNYNMAESDKEHCKHWNSASTNVASFAIMDEVSGEEQLVKVSKSAYGVEMYPEGYSTAEGYGCVKVDFYDRTDENTEPLRVLVWSDIKTEEPTHIVPLSGAKN